MDINEVDAVLKAFAASFIEDVPATHKGGKYLIEYEDLRKHMFSMTEQDLSQVQKEMEAFV